MTATAQKKVDEIMKCLYADGYERLPDWKGCEVYIPKHNKPMIIGGPWLVFVCGDDARKSTKDEAWEYQEYFQSLTDSGNSIKTAK